MDEACEPAEEDLQGAVVEGCGVFARGDDEGGAVGMFGSVGLGLMRL